MAVSFLSSQECFKKIEGYSSTIAKINRLKTSCTACRNTLNNGNKYFERIIINGEQVGYEDLSTVSSNLETVNGYLDEIITECNKQRDFYREEYAKAIEREKMAMYNSGKSNSTGSSSSSNAASNKAPVSGPKRGITTNHVR